MFTKKLVAQSLIAIQTVTCSFGAAMTHANETAMATPEATLMAQVYTIEANGKSQE